MCIRDRDNPLDNQSFWRIWIEGDKVYFQSFSHIYVYDHHTITPVDGPNAFLLLLKVRNEYWVQEMYGALYQLHNGILNKIPGSEFLNGTTTRVILPYDTDPVSYTHLDVYKRQLYYPQQPSEYRR